MKQDSLFENTDTKNADQASLGSGCTLEFVGRRKEKAILYRNGVHMKVVDLSDLWRLNWPNFSTPKLVLKICSQSPILCGFQPVSKVPKNG